VVQRDKIDSCRLGWSEKVLTWDKFWTSICESMRTWVRITTRLRQTDGTLIVNRQDTRPAAEVAQISSAAGVDPAIHRTRTRLTS